MQNNFIDLRSDTVTWPTAAMRQAMSTAAVGDDVYGDDPTVNALEQMAATLLGKEAALFAASGTMANQLALMAQVRPGDEIILTDRCHIVCHEAGAAAILSGAQLRCLPVKGGLMDLSSIEAAIRKTPEDIHSPRTALICLENADSDGYILPLDYMRQVREIAGKYGIPVHLDGARLFNAAVALSEDPAEIASFVDTVQICLSKGLCAPIGSLLVGSKEIIELARRKRKILGGGMRQAGILAAAGIIALRDMRLRLEEDHANARWLAEQLAGYSSWFNLLDQPRINMVFLRLTDYPFRGKKLCAELQKAGILINEPEDDILRLVTHYWIDRSDLKNFLKVLEQLAAK